MKKHKPLCYKSPLPVPTTPKGKKLFAKEVADALFKCKCDDIDVFCVIINELSEYEGVPSNDRKLSFGNCIKAILKLKETLFLLGRDEDMKFGYIFSIKLIAWTTVNSLHETFIIDGRQL